MLKLKHFSKAIYQNILRHNIREELYFLFFNSLSLA